MGSPGNISVYEDFPQHSSQRMGCQVPDLPWLGGRTQEQLCCVPVEGALWQVFWTPSMLALPLR